MPSLCWVFFGLFFQGFLLACRTVSLTDEDVCLPTYSHEVGSLTVHCEVLLTVHSGLGYREKEMFTKELGSDSVNS